MCEKGINDMPIAWRKENEWNERVYRKWKHMLQRVYSEKYHDKHPKYIDSTLQLELHWLSYFVENITKIKGYNYDKFMSGELELDKDILSDGKNKEYSVGNCMFVSKSENIKQANKTRNNDYLKGINNPMYGKKHTEETKTKISEKHKGKYSGKNNPKARKIAQYDKSGNLIKIWDYIKQTKDFGFNPDSISACCRGIYKTSGGFVWKYLEGGDEIEY